MTSSTTPHSTILILDLPPKTFVGIDLISFNSSPNFHGITNIPLGFHFLFTGADAGLSVRYGTWLRCNAVSSSPQIHVLRWSHGIESLEVLEGSSTAASAAVRSIPSLRGRGLVDYVALQDANADLQAKQSETNPTTTTTASITSESGSPSSGTETWSLLTRHITLRTLDRIFLPPRPTSTNPKASSLPWTISSISSAPADSESIPGLTTQESARVLHDNGASSLNFVPVNLKQTWPDDSIGRDRTEKARDRSWYLGHLIDQLSLSLTTAVAAASSSLSATGGGDDRGAVGRQVGAKAVLGEIQFCFLIVLTLANYSCLEQWKRLLGVVFTCKSALTEVEGFFVEVLKVLRAQLERVEDVEGGLFEMGDEVGSAWLRGLLRTFRGNVDEVVDKEDEEERRLDDELSGLERWLKKAYGWENEGDLLRKGMVDLEDGERVEVQMDGLDEDEETGEYAPVIVDM